MELANVPDDEFGAVVSKVTQQGFDSCRYYNWGSFALKNVVSGKKTVSKIRDAMDNAREELLKQEVGTAEEFISLWIKNTVAKLGSDASSTLPHTTAPQLFIEMITSGGGLPLWLAAGPGAKGATPTVRQ